MLLGGGMRAGLLLLPIYSAGVLREEDGALAGGPGL